MLIWFFFFSSRRRHTRWPRDWSSDVCSSDLDEGARKFSLKAKIAGGAQMFTFQTSSEITRIGPRNITAVKERLKMHRIPIVAEDVGGNNGRTIEFDAITGMLKVRAVNQEEKFI